MKRSAFIFHVVAAVKWLLLMHLSIDRYFMRQSIQTLWVSASVVLLNSWDDINSRTQVFSECDGVEDLTAGWTKCVKFCSTARSIYRGCPVSSIGPGADRQAQVGFPGFTVRVSLSRIQSPAPQTAMVSPARSPSWPKKILSRM